MSLYYRGYTIEDTDHGAQLAGPTGWIDGPLYANVALAMNAIDGNMVAPTRIQRKRTAKWRMPPNTIYVGRPGPWANDYRVGIDGTAQECVALFRADLEKNAGLIELVRLQLKGRNLACWCKPSAPCHADVLLEVANPTEVDS